MLLERSPFETDAGAIIGRDPRVIAAEQWAETHAAAAVGLRAMRAKCMDCCGDSFSEVRKCTVTRCALWPFRMGSFPKGLRALRKFADDSEESEVA